MTFQQIRTTSAPEVYTWKVSMYDDQQLKQIDKLTAEVYEKDEQEVLHPAFGIRAEYAHDAEGTAVPTSLAVSAGNLVTLTVHYKAGNPAAGGAPFVLPITAGAGWEGGFVTEYVDIPDEEKEATSEPEQQWSGWTGVSPPEPIDASDTEATASGLAGVKRSFIHVNCTHTSVLYGPDDLYRLGDFEEDCGNPFKNIAGHEIAWREAVHGKYLWNWLTKVWHEGGATTGIGCATDHSTFKGYPDRIRKSEVDRCTWWGVTASGDGGASATGKHHITAFGQGIGEEKSGCGDCNGTPNPWVVVTMPPMAFYMYVHGDPVFRETDCIDC
jgi:hypothetical protein